jgi:hypothetical protein
VKDGVETTRDSAHYVFTLREMLKMLEESGLRPVAIHSSHDGSEFRAGMPYLLLTAENT